MTKSCLHFVGFKGDEFVSAVKVWGKPDFYHRRHDARFYGEFDPENDVAVFARGTEAKVSEYSFNDSEVF
jgi:hypothetical protein